MIIPVILSGGAGTRLWPLSTPERPKQFLPLLGQRTLFQETLKRLDSLPGLAAPVVVCNADHAALVEAQLAGIGVEAATIVLEPAGRNTAPAICVAAELVSAELVSDTFSATAEKVSDTNSPILLILPADHLIHDTAAFHTAITTAVQAAEAGHLVTFGIVPTRAETGFGYIEQGASEGAWSAVVRFVEKPDQATAEGYLATGRFLWNSGMFVFDAQSFLTELERTAPAIRAACTRAAAAAATDGSIVRLGPEFLECPADSVDYAVMEKTDRAAVVPLDAGWSDVGSWAALHEALEPDEQGNVLSGDTVAIDASGSLVLAGLRKVALLGLDNVVVIDAGDTVLVMSKERSQDLKRLLSHKGRKNLIID